MTGSDGNRLHISSYQAGAKLVTVVVNRTNEDVNIDLTTNKSKYKTAETHVTSAQYSLFPVQKYNKQTGITIPAQSVTTVISSR